MISCMHAQVHVRMYIYMYIASVHKNGIVYSEVEMEEIRTYVHVHTCCTYMYMYVRTCTSLTL